MLSFMLFVMVAILAFGWARSVRIGRVQWLERLSLPGTWRCEEPGATLELRGALSQGEYVETSSGGTERGHWTLRGHTLTLTPVRESENDYEIRLFDEGRIGIDGPGRERRIYQKQQSNVVPLRRRH